ncbi:MAG: hypothetical protein PHW87_07570 [Methanothrix sp.]|nr:hypothetical protein [Methanothrix sp.]
MQSKGFGAPDGKEILAEVFRIKLFEVDELLASLDNCQKQNSPPYIKPLNFLPRLAIYLPVDKSFQ